MGRGRTRRARRQAEVTSRSELLLGESLIKFPGPPCSPVYPWFKVSMAVSRNFPNVQQIASRHSEAPARWACKLLTNNNNQTR
jgi:hypothetical protein